MSTVKRPDNGQKADIVAHASGMVCLRTYDTVSRATRWYTLQDVQVCNPTVHVAGMQPQDFKSGLLYDQPQMLVFNVLPEMVGTINHAIGVTLVYPPLPVRKPVLITVYHSAMRPAA